MQSDFENILSNIKQSSLHENSRDELTKMIKDLEKQVTRLEFKYQKTLQEKYSLSTLLEQSISELEEKNANIEQNNKILRDTNLKLIVAEEEIRQNTEELKTVNETLEEKIVERTAEIAEQKAIIEEKNEKITHSITYAQNIQKAFFPEISEIKASFKDAFVFFRPMDIVSGDFYWFYQNEHKCILAAADCTGHGVPGAFMSIIANEFLNQLIIENKIIEPDEILNALHKKIRTTLKQSEGDNRDGLDIALTCLDKKTNLLTYSGAKNPIIFIQNGNMVLIKGDKMPVGGEQRETERIFTKHQIPIDFSQNSEAAFYIFSDGYQDQFGGEENKKFLSARFRDLLFSIHQKACDEQELILEKTIDEWIGPMGQIDDILVIGVKI